jgi:thioredoxin 1
MSELLHLDDSNLDQSVKNAGLPVFIDLWAEWCMPCKKVEPVIKDLANEYAGKVVFSKLNIDENPKTAERFQIMSIPMFLILDNNMKVLEQFIGAVPKQKFIDKIESALKKL